MKIKFLILPIMLFVSPYKAYEQMYQIASQQMTKIIKEEGDKLEQRQQQQKQRQVCNYCNGSGKCSWSTNAYNRYYCHGSGTCANCYGRGRVSNPYSSGEVQCTFCNGSGKCGYCYGSGRCQHCGGAGYR